MEEPIRYMADAMVPCDGSGRVLRPGFIEVSGDTITRVGSDPGSTGVEPVRQVRIDGVLLPGLVNVHCHSPMTLFRGAGEDLALERWLSEVLWPREARMTEEDVFWGMTLAAAELLCFGVTTSCEVYFHPDALIDAVVAAGSRVVLCPAVLQLPGQADGGRWWEAPIAAIGDLHARRHGEHGRVDIGFGPHAPYTVPLDGLVDVAAACRELDALLHIHLAETESEVARFEECNGRTEAAALADAGVFDGRVLAAHSIWLTDEDLALYRELDVAVAHCPQSNAKLASGIAPLARLLELGVRVGIGTDGPASNNDLDLWEEIRLAAMLCRLREARADALGSEAAMGLATVGAGRTLGRPDLGVLAVGARADFIALDDTTTALVPLLDDAQLI
ncbi:MAG: amidohydrolase family protein, partial [Acidimicrobiales bacterium]